MQRRTTIMLALALAATAAFAVINSSGQVKPVNQQRKVRVTRSGVVNLGQAQRLRFVALNTGDAPARVRLRLGGFNAAPAGFQQGGLLEPGQSASSGWLILQPGQHASLDSTYAQGYGVSAEAHQEVRGGQSPSVRYTFAVVDLEGKTVALGGQEFEVLELGGQDFE